MLVALPVHLPPRGSVAPVEAAARCGEHSRLSGAPPIAHTRTIISLAGSHPELAPSEPQHALEIAQQYQNVISLMTEEEINIERKVRPTPLVGTKSYSEEN